MMRRVVDASVIAAAMFHEPHADAAQRILTGDDELHAPDLVGPEFGNVIWKRLRQEQIDLEEANLVLNAFVGLPLHITPSSALLESAFAIAAATDRTVYDCMYIALALQNECAVITTDTRLVNALKSTPMSDYVRHVRAEG